MFPSFISLLLLIDNEGGRLLSARVPPSCVCSVRVQVIIKAAADYLFTARQIGLFKIERGGDFFDDVCAQSEKTLAALEKSEREMNADKFNCN